MITIEDYFGPWMNHADADVRRKANAQTLLAKVNALLEDAEAAGVELKVNPITGTLVSGQTFGGFRPQSCPQGAPTSSHKEGRGVDVVDRSGALDDWITDATLEHHGLYREHPEDTPNWCHLTDRAPGSGRRTFKP